MLRINLLLSLPAVLLSIAGPNLATGTVAQQGYLKASNPGASDSFGYAVAVSGNTVVVGAEGEDSSATGINGLQIDEGASNSGAAYIFVRDGASWLQQAYVKASNTDAVDAFGRSVAISGDTLVVGAPGEDSSATGVDGDQSDNSLPSGAAYVFVRDGSTWSQQAYLKSPAPALGDQFGGSVAVSGDTVVVGAPGRDSFAGAAYVFVRSGSTWTEQATLQASNAESDDIFAADLALDADTLVVGARYESSNASGVNGDGSNNSGFRTGAAYVFRRDAGIWSQTAYLKASNPDPEDEFGASVAVAGDRIAVGANSEDSSATGIDGDQTDNATAASGAVYVFERMGLDWAQEAYIKPTSFDSGDIFGWSLALTDSALLVGARGDDSSATGIGGDQGDNSALTSGAAYLFSRSGSNWSEVAYLKSSNTEEGDIFGDTVSACGDLFVVGARWEDGASPGIDGDQDNNLAFQAGAAYAFSGCFSEAHSVETVRSGTPPNPLAFLPGQTSGPVIGATWDPVIDHTSFATNSTVDFMIVSGGPTNIPLALSTLLCNPAASPFLLLGNGGAPGDPFQVPLPDNCPLIGFALCAQGGSILPDNTTPLANALDVTIGAL